MAHASQLKFVELTAKHLNPNTWNNLKVLEIGSYDVNGSVRPYFLASEYVGVDLIPGPGVDIVAEGDRVDYPAQNFDVAISCECFEHNPKWVETFRNMHRMTKNGGVIIISCASRGRLEHGTARTYPESSPGTQAFKWDYYRNLEEADFHKRLDLEKMFSKYIFSYNPVSQDLYFVGTKVTDQGEAIFNWDRDALLQEIDSIKRIIVAPRSTKPAFLRALSAIGFLPFRIIYWLPDKLFQDIAVPYSKLKARLRALMLLVLRVKD